MASRTLRQMLGLLMLLFSVTLILPLAISLLDGDQEHWHYLWPMAGAFGLGLALWWPLRGYSPRITRRRGFVIVAGFWLVFSLLGALPFLIGPHLSFVDSLFEAVSGVTTTGATVIPRLEALPRSLLFFRQELQWLGGMGLVLLTLAVLPALRIGGMSLYLAEIPGPKKEERLLPRVSQTATVLWGTYLGLTLMCALGYFLAGMGPFDALAHSLSTVSTGGFSPYDASLGHFDSVAVESVAMLFMLLAALNFGLHFAVIHEHRLGPLFADQESRQFLVLLGFGAAVVTLGLVIWGDQMFDSGLRLAAFHVISVVTSTGFITEDFSQWPVFLATFLMVIGFVGGCGGSTAGGIKVFRISLLLRQGLWTMRRQLHPHGVFPITYNGQHVDQHVIDQVWGFFGAYVLVFVLLTLAMIAAGLDLVSALAAVDTCINNIGPGLGEVATSFAGTGDAVKLFGVAAMLLGRLEIFTLLILFYPPFWRD